MQVQVIPVAWLVRSAEALTRGERLECVSYRATLDQCIVKRRSLERRLTERAGEDRRAVVAETIRLAFDDFPRRPAPRQSARLLKAA